MSAHAAPRTEPLPAWSLPAGAEKGIELAVEWPAEFSRDWAWGGSTGRGVRVCILDSGIEPDHPSVGRLAGAVAVVRGPDGEITIEQDEAGASARAALEGSGRDLWILARLAGTIYGLEDDRRAVGLALLASLDKLLGDESRAAGPPGSPAPRS